MSGLKLWSRRLSLQTRLRHAAVTAMLTSFGAVVGNAEALGDPQGAAVRRAAAQSCFPLRATPVSVAPPIEAATGRLLRVAAARYRDGVAGEDRWSLERALDALELAFALRQSPEFVLNMAQVQRHLGRCEQARCLYTSYLDVADSPEGRALALHHLGEMTECPVQTAPDLPLGNDVRLRLSNASDTMREASPAELSLDELVPVGETSSSHVPRLLAVGTGVAVAWAAVDFGLAMRADRNANGLLEDDEALRGIQRQGRASQKRARTAGSVALALGVLAALGFWWDAQDASAPLMVGPSGSLRMWPALGAEPGLQFSASF